MSDNIHIKLPDGSDKEMPKGSTALDVAKSISPRLAEAAIAAKVFGNVAAILKAVHDVGEPGGMRQAERVSGFMQTRQVDNGIAEQSVLLAWLVTGPAGRLVAFVHPRSLHGVLLELVEEPRTRLGRTQRD